MPSAAWAPSPRRWRGSARQRGVRSRPTREVCERCGWKEGRAVGVALKDGTELEADARGGQRQPEAAVPKLVDRSTLRRGFPDAHGRAMAQRVRHVPHECGAVRVAGFPCLPGKAPADHHAAGIIMAPSLEVHGAGLLRAREPAGLEAPIVEMLIPSVVDDTLAPPGKHVASLFCQHVAPELPDGRPGTSIDEVALT